jgi:hypothetical protein
LSLTNFFGNTILSDAEGFISACEHIRDYLLPKINTSLAILCPTSTSFQGYTCPVPVPEQECWMFRLYYMYQIYLLYCTHSHNNITSIIKCNHTIKCIIIQFTSVDCHCSDLLQRLCGAMWNCWGPEVGINRFLCSCLWFGWGWGYGSGLKLWL